MSKGYGARTEAESKAALATVAKAEKAGIRTVQLQFVDLHGITKSVQIPIHMMPNAVKHGTWFDGSSVEGFTRIAESDQMCCAPTCQRGAFCHGRPPRSALARRA